MLQTYTRGTLLWVDDNLGNRRLWPGAPGSPASPGPPAQKWRELFGNASDRLFRLMDLSLEVACSYEEAMEAVRNCGAPEAAGAFVLTVLDLGIPRHGSRPQMKHGISVAEELRRRKLPFVFLSANANATRELDEAGLGTVQYYVKETSGGAWRLPDALVQNVLSVFRRNICWVSLADVVDSVHPESDVVRTHAKAPETFEHFPFFGPYADFVQRWEHKPRLDLPSSFVVTATVDHCEEFIQQALSLMLYQRFAHQPQAVRFRYGQAHHPGYRNQLRSLAVVQDTNTISAIRIWPENTSLEELRELLQEAGCRAGTTVFVLPNDESADQYAELLRQFHIPTIEEIPQTPWGDAPAREELVKRTCALVFQRWNQPSEQHKAMPLPLSYLAHPELLINPVDWIVLQEAQSVARELSDPYEVTKELLLATRNMSAPQYREFRKAVTRELPLPYRRLLRVGHETLCRSESAHEMPKWIERALDLWLNTSWHFPYGLGRQFAQLQEGEDSEEAWRGRNWKAWEDSCYEILVGMLGEYEKRSGPQDALTPRQADLARVRRFAKHLGGAGFLTADPSAVDWESLESFRWPHERYPMPAAVNRRLKTAKRYLWIQPEGLDTALSLPRGRLRYRFLSEMVEQYSSVLQWGEAVAPKLPLGWQSGVLDLVRVVRDHRVADAWRHRKGRQEMWNALLGLLRNGVPVMFIADWVLRGKRLTGMTGPESAEKVLKKSKGSGSILGKLRSPRAARRHGCLVTRWQPAAADHYLKTIRQVSHLLGMAPPETGAEVHAIAGKLGNDLAELLGPKGDLPAPDAAGGDSRATPVLAAALAKFMADDQLGLTDLLEFWAKSPSRETRNASPVAMLESLFKTKGDYLWHTLDTLAILGDLTYPYRYFDGYHFLSTLNDLRKESKDFVPRQEDVHVAEVETVLDLFVAAVEGLVAQLAWCLELAGKEKRAESIAPKNVWVRPPADFAPPPAEELSQLLRVVAISDQYAVGTLGSPVPDKTDRLCYHEAGAAVPVDERDELPE